MKKIPTEELLRAFYFKRKQTKCILAQGTTLAHLTGNNKKLRYREEHSASVVLRWCTL